MLAQLASALFLATALSLAGSATPASGESTIASPALNPWLERFKRRQQLLERAMELRPRRRDFPTRYVNISDEEIREIQAVSRQFVPRAVVNIGAVTTGCPCEDGVDCSEQVWIVAVRADQSFGLLMSRVNKRWDVGPVQRWWLRLEELHRNPDRFASYQEFLAAEDELLDELPACAAANPLLTETSAH